MKRRMSLSLLNSAKNDAKCQCETVGMLIATASEPHINRIEHQLVLLTDHPMFPQLIDLYSMCDESCAYVTAR